MFDCPAEESRILPFLGNDHDQVGMVDDNRNGRDNEAIQHTDVVACEDRRSVRGNILQTGYFPSGD